MNSPGPPHRQHRQARKQGSARRDGESAEVEDLHQRGVYDREGEILTQVRRQPQAVESIVKIP
eukprot:6559437-Pyramimonas_sp.AAC.1